MEKLNIRTFAIFDTETSGFPDANFNKANICELCIATISRADILDKSQPRLVNKLSLILNPRMMINPEATKITGLDNYMLEHENHFDDNAAETICGFFKHLKGPICLIAHNGNKFDFPLFKKAFEKLNKTLPDNVYCADTYEALRYLDHMKLEKEKLDIQDREYSEELLKLQTKFGKDVEKMFEASSNDNQQTSNGTSDEILAFRLDEEDQQNNSNLKTAALLDKDVEFLNDISNEKTSSDTRDEILAFIFDEKDEQNDLDSKTSSLLDKDVEYLNDIPLIDLTNIYEIEEKRLTENKTPLDAQKLNETTPKHRPVGKHGGVPYKKSGKLPGSSRSDILVEAEESSAKYKPKQPKTKSKKQLFVKTAPRLEKLPRNPKGFYTLTGIFQRLFSYLPAKSHHAEADVLMLQEIVLSYGKDFIEYCDDYAIPFSEIRTARSNSSK